MSEPNSMRVTQHPILGDLPTAATFEITFDGRPIAAREGDTVAAVLIANGVKVFRHTHKRGEPRQIFCAIGRCTDCAMMVDGQPNVRTCVTLARPGMTVETQHGLGEWQIDAKGDA